MEHLIGHKGETEYCTPMVIVGAGASLHACVDALTNTQVEMLPHDHPDVTRLRNEYNIGLMSCRTMLQAANNDSKLVRARIAETLRITEEWRTSCIFYAR